MNKGMMIRCGGCGTLKALNLNGGAKQIEAEINSTIAEDGWRFVKAWDGWICSSCRTNGTDKLYEAYAGKPKPIGKLGSYEELLKQAIQQLQAFKDLEGIR